jgi:hypothetical protein
LLTWPLFSGELSFSILAVDMTPDKHRAFMRLKRSPAAVFPLLALIASGYGFAADLEAASAPQGGSCYAGARDGAARSLRENRDRLIADLARRKSTDSCALWGSLNKAERYIFLMDTAYLGDKTSRIYPPASGKLETALDHAVALYSINGPKAGEGVDRSGREATITTAFFSASTPWRPA